MLAATKTAPSVSTSLATGESNSRMIDVGIHHSPSESKPADFGQSNHSVTRRENHLSNVNDVAFIYWTQSTDQVFTVSLPPLPLGKLPVGKLNQQDGDLTNSVSTTQAVSVEPGDKVKINTEPKGFVGWLTNRITLYGGAELTGSVTAGIGIALTSILYPSSAAIGIIGTACENLGLYSVLLYNAMNTATRELEQRGESHTWKTRSEVAGKLVAQFGVAEICDSLFIRPALMSSGSAVGYYLGQHLLGHGPLAMAVGAGACKLVADVIYWSMVEATGAVIKKVENKQT
jgi:hypothetical protein